MRNLLCIFHYHNWSAPFKQRYESVNHPWAKGLEELVCCCIRENCRAKQLFLEGTWLTIHD
jgi:23S rRNA C2498 (ribose-2'-O)-methylase RlmM